MTYNETQPVTHFLVKVLTFFRVTAAGYHSGPWISCFDDQVDILVGGSDIDPVVFRIFLTLIFSFMVYLTKN